MDLVNNRSRRAVLRAAAIVLIGLFVMTFSTGQAHAVGSGCFDHGDGNDGARHYICDIYESFLHNPSDGEVSYWVGALSSSSSSAVANALVGSQETAMTFLNQVYDVFLDRGSDPGGAHFWVDRMQSGSAFEDVEAALAASDEAFAAQGNTNAYVGYLYDRFLDRVATGDEIDYWSGLITAGTLTRGQVATVFSRSPEHLNQFVNAMYEGILGRPADPDGYDYWTSTIRSTGRRAVYIAFLGSAEGYANLSSVV